ncbi:MAG: transcription termination/antitermination protein NusG [Muribaculaceae bacterium]|nr:transcription termination/antitermination protein NusG [Muribaculaceae bacterium]MDE7109879.1 transcription termination/antitermination protein NusG [Muribaculaceae bacterium]
MAENKKQWYVLRAISGKEAKVKEVLDAAIKNTNLGQYVSQVLIPTEKVYTTRNGKKVVKERNLYSGYVFIQAELTGEVIYELRNTTNVIDFLRGRAKNSEPESLRDAEVRKMLGAADDFRSPQDENTLDYIEGESVKVNFGPFSGFTGVVREVNTERKRMKVEVKIFGRPTDLELEYSQVERV